jgi:hypothetical protein
VFREDFEFEIRVAKHVMRTGDATTAQKKVLVRTLRALADKLGESALDPRALHILRRMERELASDVR